VAARGAAAAPPQLAQESVFQARSEALALHMAPAVEEYIVQLVVASRDPAPYSDELAHWIDYGGSPRATIALDRCARAHAWLRGRDFVSPDDVQAVAADVLRHRLLLSFEAEAAGVQTDQVIDELLRLVPVA
jgi:MoxR-like ATPase